MFEYKDERDYAMMCYGRRNWSGTDYYRKELDRMAKVYGFPLSKVDLFSHIKVLDKYESAVDVQMTIRQGGFYGQLSDDWLDGNRAVPGACYGGSCRRHCGHAGGAQRP